MNDFTIFLLNLRKKNKMTQEYACRGICSLREYQRIEKGQSNPSFFFLHEMSKRYGYDIESFYRLLETNGGMRKVYEDQRELAKLAAKHSHREIHEKVLEHYNEKEYQQNTNRNMLLYYDASYYAQELHDYETSNRMCLEIIHSEDPAATLELPCGRVFSEYSIYAVHIIALNYSAQGYVEKMISIYNELIARIECLDRDYLSNYQSTSFRRLLHQKLSCNLAINYIKVSNYQLASSIIEDSINYGIKYNYLKLLPEFCMLKVKVLCHENKYDEAKKRLESAKALFDLTNRYSDYKEAEEILQSEFPDFFSYYNDKL